MKPADFFNKLRALGQPKCQLYKRYSKRQQSEANWYSHFGHCLNDHYHFCNFILDPKPIIYMVHYQRKATVNGEEMRVRSGLVQQKDFRTGRPGRPKFNPGGRARTRNH